MFTRLLPYFSRIHVRELVHGSPIYEDEEQGIRYEAGPQTFLQVNENVRGKLYNAALKTVIDTGDEVVVDAYSGGGLLTAICIAKNRMYAAPTYFITSST